MKMGTSAVSTNTFLQGQGPDDSDCLVVQVNIFFHCWL